MGGNFVIPLLGLDLGHLLWTFYVRFTVTYTQYHIAIVPNLHSLEERHYVLWKSGRLNHRYQTCSHVYDGPPVIFNGYQFRCQRSAEFHSLIQSMP